MSEHRQQSDAALIAAMRAGDSSTYDELYARHHDAVLAQARRLSPPGRRASDLAADAFTRFYLDTTDGGGPAGAVRPYLYRALRLAASGGRGTPVSAGPAVPAEKGHLAELLGITEPVDPRAEWALQALRSFPEPAQSALWYHDVEGVSSRDTARIVGVSVSYLGEILLRARPVWYGRAWPPPTPTDPAALAPEAPRAPVAADPADLARILAAAALGPTSPAERSRRRAFHLPAIRLSAIRLPAMRVTSWAWLRGRGVMVAASVVVVGVVGVSAVAATRAGNGDTPIDTPDDSRPVQTGTVVLADPVPATAATTTAATVGPETSVVAAIVDDATTIAPDVAPVTTAAETTAVPDEPFPPAATAPAGRSPGTTAPRRGTTTAPAPFPGPLPTTAPTPTPAPRPPVSPSPGSPTTPTTPTAPTTAPPTTKATTTTTSTTTTTTTTVAVSPTTATTTTEPATTEAPATSPPTVTASSAPPSSASD